jgi:hypothetical protein
MAATMGGGRTAGATWGSRRASRRAGNMLSCNNPCILSYCLSRVRGCCVVTSLCQESTVYVHYPLQAAPSSSPRGQGSPATHVAASAGPLPHSQAVQAAQPDPLTVTVRLARARAALTSQVGTCKYLGLSYTSTCFDSLHKVHTTDRLEPCAACFSCCARLVIQPRQARA